MSPHPPRANRAATARAALAKAAGFPIARMLDQRSPAVVSLRTALWHAAPGVHKAWGSAVAQRAAEGWTTGTHGGASIRTVRVLVVEDEVRLASLIRRGLRENGLLVDVALKGEDALWMAASSPYDVLTLDVLLPGIDGFEVCRRLREDQVRTPILMLTARDDVEHRIAGLDAGADDYLVKPFDFGELVARLRALARDQARPGGRAAPPGSGAEPLPAARGSLGQRLRAPLQRDRRVRSLPA